MCSRATHLGMLYVCCMFVWVLILLYVPILPIRLFKKNDLWEYINITIRSQKKNISSEFLFLCAISLEEKYVQNVWNPFLSHHRLSVEEKHYFVQCTHPFLFNVFLFDVHFQLVSSTQPNLLCTRK